MDISVVVPVYNERESLAQFYLELKSSLDRLSKDYQILFVDDASDDGSFEILGSLQLEDEHVKVINFMKRKGQLYALTCGLKNAEGEIFIILDADLQYDPNEIGNFLQKIQDGFDAVGGIRRKRFDSPYRILISKTANFIIRALTGTKIHDLGCSFNAFKKEIYERVTSRYGKDIILTKPLIAKFSENYIEVEVNHFPRKIGKSKNKFTDLFFLFLINIQSGNPFLLMVYLFVKRKFNER